MGVLVENMMGQPIIVAIVLSILTSILISVAGVIPSAFLTGANILYFGFLGGIIISIIGEALGGIISFFLYRKGLKKLGSRFSDKPKIVLIEKLKLTQGVEAFMLVFLLRIFPFAPSGMVTLAASISKIGGIAFAISSTIGKIPALLIEAYSVNSILSWEREFQVTAGIIVLVISVCYYYLKKNFKTEDCQ